jgi:RimJ/RimL family protein N-acetyltransferase
MTDLRANPAGAAAGIAVLRLNPRHRDDIARHLLQLPADDRRLRFGQAISDGAVRSYVAGIDFGRDSVFGIHAAALDLVGVAHLALDPGPQVAELGLSVDPAARTRGYGFALLQRAVLHAANLGYRALFMYCLAENAIMMRLAQKAGLTVVIERGEADARLRLDRFAHGGAIREALADQVALVDVLLKQQFLWLAQPKPAAARSIDEVLAGERGQREGAGIA